MCPPLWSTSWQCASGPELRTCDPAFALDRKCTELQEWSLTKTCRRSQTEAPSALRGGLGETEVTAGVWGQGHWCGPGDSVRGRPVAEEGGRWNQRETRVSWEEAGWPPLSGQPEAHSCAPRVRLGAGRSSSPSLVPSKLFPVRRRQVCDAHVETKLASRVNASLSWVQAASSRGQLRPSLHQLPPHGLGSSSRSPVSPADTRGPSSSFTVCWSEVP